MPGRFTPHDPTPPAQPPTTQQPQPSMQLTRPHHGPNYGARSSAIQQRAASATAVRVATRHCCSATAGRAGPAAPAASVPAEPAASARFCLATAGLAGAVPPVASAPVAMAETRCWSATAATVGQVPVGLLAVPVARAGCYSAKMGCPGRERPNPGQPPMGNLHINWPGRQQTAHIYEIGSRSVGGAGKSGCKSWLGSVGWRRA